VLQDVWDTRSLKADGIEDRLIQSRVTVLRAAGIYDQGRKLSLSSLPNGAAFRQKRAPLHT
jgi:hypothetical protein